MKTAFNFNYSLPILFVMPERVHDVILLVCITWILVLHCGMEIKKIYCIEYLLTYLFCDFKSEHTLISLQKNFIHIILNKTHKQKISSRTSQWGIVSRKLAIFYVSNKFIGGNTRLVVNRRLLRSFVCHPRDKRFQPEKGTKL